MRSLKGGCFGEIPPVMHCATGDVQVRLLSVAYAPGVEQPFPSVALSPLPWRCFYPGGAFLSQGGALFPPVALCFPQLVVCLPPVALFACHRLWFVCPRWRLLLSPVGGLFASGGGFAFPGWRLVCPRWRFVHPDGALLCHSDALFALGGVFLPPVTLGFSPVALYRWRFAFSR